MKPEQRRERSRIDREILANACVARGFTTTDLLNRTYAGNRHQIAEEIGWTMGRMSRALGICHDRHTVKTPPRPSPAKLAEIRDAAFREFGIDVVPRRNMTHRDASVEAQVRLREAGATLKQIADTMGFSSHGSVVTRRDYGYTDRAQVLRGKKVKA